MNGIQIDTDYRLIVRPRYNTNGLIISGMQIGDITDQVVALVLGMQQGELKEDPLLGASLTKYIRGKSSQSEIEQRIRLHLTRAGVNYREYINYIRLNINTEAK